MTRTQYDELSEPLVRVLNDMEDEIIRLIAQQLARDGDFSDTSKWRIRQLARSGSFSKEVAKRIASYADVQWGQAEQAVTSAAFTEIGYLDEAVREAARLGYINGSTDIPAERSAFNASKAFLKQAESDLNLVNTVMRYKAKNAFVKAVNDTYFSAEEIKRVHKTLGKHSASTVMGQVSLQEAARRCIKELSEKGIPAFVDKRGHEWPPESYIMMDMRSTLANTARAAQNERCDKYGIQLIEVSSHMGARPLCAEYQGRIFSRDGSRGTTEDGSGRRVSYIPLSETSFGEPGGLFGVNCGHVQYPFIPGVNIQRYFPYDEEKNSERYKQLQRQRYLERKIKSTKRECMMYKAVNDDESFRLTSLKLRQQRSQYSSFCKSTGLAQHNDRTQVYGFDRSVSSKAVWAERKAKAAVPSISTKNTPAVEVKAPAEVIRGNTEKVYKNEPVPVKYYTQKELDKLSTEKLRKETAALAEKYYSSGKSGISFGNKGPAEAARTLSAQSSRAELKKDYMALKKKVQGLDKSEQSGIIKMRGEDVTLELQRYGRNKNTLVNKTYVDSGDYKRKFDKATDNPEVNKTLYDCAKQALKHRSGTAYEDMFWIDLSNGNLVLAVTDSTDERAIAYTDTIRKTIKGKKNLVTLHTHPSSMPPSIDDFNSSYRNGYQIGFVACHDGKLFRYSSKQEISKNLYNLYMNEFIDDGLSEYDAQWNTIIKLCENHSISIEEVG